MNGSWRSGYGKIYNQKIDFAVYHEIQTTEEYNHKKELRTSLPSIWRNFIHIQYITKSDHEKSFQYSKNIISLNWVATATDQQVTVFCVYHYFFIFVFQFHANVPKDQIFDYLLV